MELIKTLSIYDNVECNEFPNRGKLRKILLEKHGIDEEQLKLLEEYNKKTKIKHKLSQHEWGRIVPVHYLSLSVMKRVIRYTLCKDVYVDIDMISAQPTIIYEICKKHNMECKYLENYIKNIETKRRKIMESHNVSKDTAKELINSIMNGGSYNSWKISNKIPKEHIYTFIPKFETEMKNIIDIIFNNNQNMANDILQIKEKTEVELKRSVMSLFYQTKERELQECAIKYLVNTKGFKLEKIVPCQDGFMILKDLYYDSLIEEIEGEIKTKCDMEIHFAIKEFDKALDIEEEINETQKTAMINTLKKYKKFVKNKEITELGCIQNINDKMIINLTELYCFHKKSDHDYPYLILNILNNGFTCLECTKCNVSVPTNGITINAQQINYIFNLTNDKEEIKKDIEDELIDKIFHKTEKQIALCLYERMNVLLKYSKNNFYIYDNDSGLWKIIETRQILGLMKDTLTHVFEKYLITIETEEEWYKICEKKKNSITKESNTKDYINDIINEIDDTEFINLIDKQPNIVNFRNGCYDLKKNEFRSRNFDDYVTKFLEYDYNNSTDFEINEVKELIKRISNDDDETLEFNLNWLGYCITGERTMQKFLIVVGHSSSNGKSTLAELFQTSLPIYTYKLLPETFCKSYAKTHKQISEIKRPVRFVYIEELPYSQLNEHLIKDFVTAAQLNNEIMYGTSENIELQCKLFIASNNDPNFEACQGFKRRCIIENLKNRFLSKSEFDEEMKITNRDYNVYLKMNLSNMFQQVKFKLAFFNLIKEYSHRFYKNNEFLIPDKISIQMTSLYEERDRIGLYLQEFYIITNDDNDKIHGDLFVEEYNTHQNSKLSKAYILNELKKHNIKYDKNRFVNKKRGVIIGLRYNSGHL